MRVVTFNIQHGLRPDGVVDIDALAAYCAGLEPDVLALQEVDVGVPRSGRVDTVARVAAATGMKAAFGPATRVGVIGRYGNGLLVRGALERVETIALPRSARRSEPRAVLAATAVLGDWWLSVAVTHLSINEAEALVQLDAVIAVLKGREAPWLLLGDLNLRPEQVEPVVRTSGLTLADPQVPTFPTSSPRIRIDHIASGGLSVDDVTVLPPAPVSDHRALCASVVLSAPSGGAAPRPRGRG